MPLNQGRAYGVYSGNVLFLPGDFHLNAVASVTASTTQTQAGGTPIVAAQNAVASVNSADAVTLPPANPGMTITILLTTSATTCGVFPAVGETINAIAANSVFTMAARTSATFMCVTAGAWLTCPRVAS